MTWLISYMTLMHHSLPAQTTVIRQKSQFQWTSNHNYTSIQLALDCLMLLQFPKAKTIGWIFPSFHQSISHTLLIHLEQNHPLCLELQMLFLFFFHRYHSYKYNRIFNLRHPLHDDWHKLVFCIVEVWTLHVLLDEKFYQLG